LISLIRIFAPTNLHFVEKVSLNRIIYTVQKLHDKKSKWTDVFSSKKVVQQSVSISKQPAIIHDSPRNILAMQEPVESASSLNILRLQSQPLLTHPKEVTKSYVEQYIVFGY